MTSHEGHRARLWERYREKGLRDGFYHAYERLEFLLTFVTPRKDTKPLAKSLLRRFGSVGGTVFAPRHQLLEVEGVGEKTAAFLKLYAEVATLIEEEALIGRDLLSESAKVKAYLKGEISWEEAEYFLVLYLDKQNHLIKKLRLFRGTIDRAVIFPREVVKEGLSCNAASVLVAHNHPSGISTPSPQDLALTKNLAKSLKTVGMVLLDHFIVGRKDTLSLRDSGQYKP